MEKEKTKELLYLDLKKILEANAVNDFDSIERIYNQIRKFILNNEKQFIGAIAIDEKKYLDDLKNAQNEWKERAEKALESKSTDECMFYLNQSNTQLEQDMQRLTIEYKDKCIESIKSYYDRL